MNNDYLLNDLSKNIVDRINILNVDVSNIKTNKKLTENEKELKLLNELYSALRKTNLYYTSSKK
jgi:hypothetical protein